MDNANPNAPAWREATPGPEPLPQALFSESDLDSESLQVRHGLRVLRRHLMVILAIGFLVPAIVIGYDLRFRKRIYAVRLQLERLSDENLLVLPSSAGRLPLSEVSLASLRRLLLSPEMGQYLRQRLREEVNVQGGAGQPDANGQPTTLAGKLAAMSAEIETTPPAFNAYRGSIRVTATSENTFRIDLVGQHPEAMRAVALHLTDGLNRLTRRNRVAQLESFVRKLEESKAKTDAELETVRLELARVNDMLRSEDTNLGAEVRRLERLRAEEADARMELEMLELQLQQTREAADWPALRRRFGIEQNEDISVVLVAGNPLRETLQQQIRQLEGLQTRYTAEHPRLLEVQRNLRLTIRRLQDEGYVTAEGKVPPLPTPREERMLAEIQTRAKALEQMQIRLEARIRQRERLEAELKAATPDSAAEEDKRRARALMDDLERLRDQEAFHRSNSRRLYNLLAESRMLLDQVRQERRFATDNDPSASLQSPNVKLDGTLGLALGVLLGCFAAFLRESVDHRLHTPFDIYYHLRLNYLGVIPYRSAKENVVISSDTPDSNLAEMYAHLRNNIRYGRAGKPEKSLLVVSATQGEGKSTIATNLAISYALEGNSVVLVDADLRRPRSHKLVDVLEGERSVNEGLSECLAGEADLPQVLYPTTTPGLSILPAGGRVRNPPKLLNGPRTAEAIRHLEDQFDIVIIDCPAMLPVVDGTTLSPLVRGVLLVVAADEVEIAEVRMTLYRLQHVGAPLVGAVLNKVRERLSSYYYGYRYRTDYRSIYATDDET